jgi:hypothetical protein
MCASGPPTAQVGAESPRRARGRLSMIERFDTATKLAQKNWHLQLVEHRIAEAIDEAQAGPVGVGLCEEKVLRQIVGIQYFTLGDSRL